MSETPLFSPGFHDISLLDLKTSLTELLVEPFLKQQIGSRRRELLLDRLIALFKEVSNLCIVFEAWIDGSFVTDKDEPNDVDVLLWYHGTSSISPRELRIYRELKDADLMSFRYHCDVYLLKDNEANRRYWQEWFGKNRDGVSKGIIRIFFSRGVI